MPTKKIIALDSTVQDLIAKMQLVSNALDPTVQRDWEEDDPDSMAYIKNKPTGMWSARTTSGNPLSVKTRTSQKALSTKLTMSPIQDLNGYDNPWPAGGGKNKFNATGTSQYCTLNNGIYTLNSVPESTLSFSMGFVSLKAGNTYILSGGYSIDFRVVFTYDGTTYMSSTGDSAPIVATTDAQVPVYGVIAKTATVNSKIYPMIRLSSDDSSWVPYSNICPISGRTSLSLNGWGKNLADFSTATQLPMSSGYVDVVDFGQDVTFDSITLTFFADGAVCGNLTGALCNFRRSDGGTNFRTPNSYGFAVNVENNGAFSRTENNITFRTLRLYFGTGYAQWSSGKMSVQLELGTASTEYEPYQQSNAITITFPALGKNIYDAVTYPMSNAWINANSGRYSESVTYSATEGYIPCAMYKGMTVTLNKRPGGTNSGVAFYSAAGENAFISGVKNDGGTVNTPMTFDIPENAEFMRFTVKQGETDIQIELGSSSSTYEPYTNTIYSGIINMETGVLTIDRALVDNPSSDWHYVSQKVFYKSFSGYNVDVIPMCNMYKGVASVTKNSDAYARGNATICLRSETEDRIYIRDDNYTDAQTFMAAISDIQIVYALATPITIQLTPAEVQLLKGQNNIWSDGDSIELTYVDDEKNISSVASNLSNINSDMAPVESSASSDNYSIGDYLTLDGVFCKVISPIEVDDDIVIGVNVVETTIGAELKSALSS